MESSEPLKIESAEAPGVPVTRAQFLNLFTAICFPMFLAAVDQTLLATATPVIAAHLGGLTDTSWIGIAYLLAAAALMPVYGRFGDMLGRRNMLITAVAIFSLGSAACGLAQSLPQLIAARVLQGLGGGGLMMLSQALIGELVAPRERVRFQGYFAIVFSSASIGGPVLGGIVVSYVSWRWLFLVNLPLTAFAVWRLCKLPRGERHPEAVPEHDYAGVFLFAGASSSSIYWLTSVGHHFALYSAASAALIVTALSAAAGLVWHERRHPAPLVPLDLLRQPAILYTLGTSFLFAAAMFALVFFLPIYLQLGHGVSALHSGLLLLPLTGGMLSGAVVTGRIVARTGEPKSMPVYGMTLASVALLLLGALPPHVVLVGVLGFVTGVGFGSVMPTNQVMVQAVAGRARLGTVTAMLSLFRSFGSAVGAALFGAVVYALMPHVDVRALVQTANAGQIASITRAFHIAFLLIAGIAAAGAYVASRVPRIVLWEKTVRS